MFEKKMLVRKRIMYLLRNKTQIGNKPVASVTIKPHEMASL